MKKLEAIHRKMRGVTEAEALAALSWTISKGADASYEWAWDWHAGRLSPSPTRTLIA